MQALIKTSLMMALLYYIHLDFVLSKLNEKILHNVASIVLYII